MFHETERDRERGQIQETKLLSLSLLSLLCLGFLGSSNLTKCPFAEYVHLSPESCYVNSRLVLIQMLAFNAKRAWWQSAIDPSVHYEVLNSSASDLFAAAELRSSVRNKESCYIPGFTQDWKQMASGFPDQMGTALQTVCTLKRFFHIPPVRRKSFKTGGKSIAFWSRW